MDLEIQTQDIALQPQWRKVIDERSARLVQRFPKIIRIHVTLKHSRHHVQGLEEVHVLANVAGETLSATKSKETMGTALRAALVALERELTAYHASLRRTIQTPGPRPQGTIARLLPERQSGFIRSERGREVSFHRNALHQLEFEKLTPGLPVEFDVEPGADGAQATRVFPVGERSTT